MSPVSSFDSEPIIAIVQFFFPLRLVRWAGIRVPEASH